MDTPEDSQGHQSHPGCRPHQGLSSHCKPCSASMAVKHHHVAGSHLCTVISTDTSPFEIPMHLVLLGLGEQQADAGTISTNSSAFEGLPAFVPTAAAFLAPGAHTQVAKVTYAD